MACLSNVFDEEIAKKRKAECFCLPFIINGSIENYFILLLGTMRLPTVRSSKLIMAAIRSRSRLLRMDLGVRRSTSIKSAKVLGVYLGVDATGFLLRYLSSLGSRNLTNFRINFSNML